MKLMAGRHEKDKANEKNQHFGKEFGNGNGDHFNGFFSSICIMCVWVLQMGLDANDKCQHHFQSKYSGYVHDYYYSSGLYFGYCPND